jgi:hypothetical protein
MEPERAVAYFRNDTYTENTALTGLTQVIFRKPVTPTTPRRQNAIRSAQSEPEFSFVQVMLDLSCDVVRLPFLGYLVVSCSADLTSAVGSLNVFQPETRLRFAAGFASDSCLELIMYILLIAGSSGCGRSLAEIVGSNPAGGMDVCRL